MFLLCQKIREVSQPRWYVRRFADCVCYFDPKIINVKVIKRDCCEALIAENIKWFTANDDHETMKVDFAAIEKEWFV